MTLEVPSNFPVEALNRFLVAMGDDELVLGHRDAEWTGHAPILEEDIAFSNIAQDEIGHALVWFTLHEQLTGKSPDWMGFERNWKHFTCCHLVAYPKGDFAYTVVRQYLFDAAEQIRLRSLLLSSVGALKEAAGKILPEEEYHLLHTQSLVERLGNATPESHRRMQVAVEKAFPQALGIFEELVDEQDLVRSGVFSGNSVLREEWLAQVEPVLTSASLKLPVNHIDGRFVVTVKPDEGGRKSWHNEYLKQLVDDLQQVYRIAPQSKW